ncbi:septum formation initiator family protein [Bifidobacterium dolichotidis]|uniref:Septum formation initiator family protein n=1 Tax=Bifidobacterium dolichotidis TaxID=2306976 RepID=A0A430FSQ4_9BIFI|nr:septum formation initiator family protein [Bifidobacterium dolichotidis]RSX55857.1 septum formation initiator family protein [Bifidobacterium dolichotidis]
MAQRRKTQGSSARRPQQTRHPSGGPIALFISLFIIALGAIQLVSTFHTYALNLSELNGLKKQEAALVAKKGKLENDIGRWDDKAYVTAQARERLGYVFQGEQPIRIEHPEAVTGQTVTEDQDDDDKSVTEKVLPWYSELAYAFKKADEPRQPQDASTQQSNAGQDNAQQQQSNENPEQN